MEAKFCYLPGSINIVADFISCNINKKLSAVSYDDDDLIQMQSNDPMLKRVLNILCNTGDDFCLTSLPTELKRYGKKLFVKDSILK